MKVNFGMGKERKWDFFMHAQPFNMRPQYMCFNLFRHMLPTGGGRLLNWREIIALNIYSVPVYGT